jgi:RNA polymerase sigma-70 factor (ECF subfamily)
VIQNFLDEINVFIKDRSQLFLSSRVYTYRTDWEATTGQGEAPRMTDSQLIREIKDGHVELFAEIVRRYEKRVILFIAQMLKSYQVDHLAEDICQETFYKAFRSLKTFRDMDASFSTWLFTIARNTVLSELRHLKNGAILTDKEENIPDYSREYMPEKQYLQKEKVSMVRRAINELPENQRVALILREYEQLDYQEISSVLGLSVSAIKSLLFRARNGIKAQMETYMVDETLIDKVRG